MEKQRIKIQTQILKQRFLSFLKNAMGYSSLSITKFEKAINHYELCHKNEDFKKFNSDRATKYKEYLTRKNYASSTFKTYLHHIKYFFSWLARQDGFRRKIKLDDIEYFNIPKEVNRLAAQRVIPLYPTHDEVMKLFNSLPSITEVDLRNRALIAFTYCTGMRDNAIRTLPFSAVNLDKMYVEQNPRLGVKVKFSKIIYSKIFEFDEEFISALVKWQKLLISKQFKPGEPFFPKSKQRQIENELSFVESTEIDREYWSSTVSVRNIFKNAANLADVKYFPPHSFRHAAIRRLIKCANNGLEIKALYQSFGHESFKIILESYANLDLNTQLEVLTNMDLNLEKKTTEEIDMDLAKKIIEIIKNSKK